MKLRFEWFSIHGAITGALAVFEIFSGYGHWRDVVAFCVGSFLAQLPYIIEYSRESDCNMCGHLHKLHKCGQLRLCRECMDAYDNE